MLRNGACTPRKPGQVFATFSPEYYVSRSHVRIAACLALTIGAAAMNPGVVHSQDVMDARSAVYLRDQYIVDLDTLHAKIVALALAIPEDKYNWRPAPVVRSVSEVLMHVASEFYYWMPMSVGGSAPADFGPPREATKKLEEISKKSDVLDQLAKSWSHGRAQVASVDAAKLTGIYTPWGVTLPQATFSMSGDLHEHLGQLISYARSVGVKPPWSK